MTWRPWQQAWHEALYAPDGFYRRPEGPAGHFATSAQGIPGVGEVLAQAIRSLAAQHELTSVVDIGAGRGELLGHLRRLDPDLRLAGVDVVARPATLAGDIAWTESPGGADLPDMQLEHTLVIAHEWLDVVPIPIAEVDDHRTLRLVEVDKDGQERLTPADRAGERPLDPAWVDWCTQHWPTTAPGHRVEVGIARDHAWESLCDKVSHGLVVAVDYGHIEAERPPYGTLTGFRSGTEVPPVPDGSCDVTAHVAVDSLVADRRVRQADLLRELELIPAAPDVSLARADPPSYLGALAARSASLHAASRPGLGDFWWVLRTV